MKTYEVSVDANALRTIRVRARSGREALEKAEQRIHRLVGPWVIDFPGEVDGHFHVETGGEWVGPDAQGDFNDEEETTDDDD